MNCLIEIIIWGCRREGASLYAVNFSFEAEASSIQLRRTEAGNYIISYAVTVETCNN